MNHTPPPFPAKKKKGKGCLWVLILGLICFVALLVVGTMANHKAEQEWAANRESIIHNIEAALDSGSDDEALKLAKPYPWVNDPALKDLIARAKQAKRDKADRVREVAKPKVVAVESYSYESRERKTMFHISATQGWWKEFT